MKISRFKIIAGSSLLAVAAASSTQTASAQSSGDSTVSLEEIVVTARRKEESLQDVPTTINAVTGAEIDKLNIRKFEDIATVVPGLVMANNNNGIGSTASVRGVNYDVNASGNNGTVEFYMNDAPISAGNLFQTVYDIQQVELLRGPQGTLRGRASPSGSMTVVTKRPDLQEMGGYVSATGTNIGGYNAQGAFNYPIITDVLAVRVAGDYEKNEGNRVVDLNNSQDPSIKIKSGRMTVRYEPTDSLSFILTAQKTKQDQVSYDQVESQQQINPSAPVINAAILPFFNETYVPPYISASQRLAVEAAPHFINNDFNNYNLQIQWAFAGQKLNYVGARNEQSLQVSAPQDPGGYFSPLAPAVYQGFAQVTDTHSYATAHELRLSNEARVFDMFDYIVGAFYQKTNAPTNLTRPTPVFNPTTTPFTETIVQTPISLFNNGTEEKSGFVNLTAHIGDALEISAGARYIKFTNTSSLSVSGFHLTAADKDDHWSTTIYTGSVKYNLTEDFMAYATVGTSWRPGVGAIGDFSLAQSALEKTFLNLEPEKSTSYEVGFKSTALEKRLRTDVSFYHQKFTNYPYRSNAGVWYISTNADTSTTPPTIFQAPAIFNFVAAVPVEVNGVEAQVDFSATSSWDMGLSAAVSKGEIKNGFIPCNTFAGSAPPSLATLQAAVGAGQTIAGCTATLRSSSAPQVSGTLQSEYRVPITSELSGFVRGQLSFYGNSKNDETNLVDDYKSYELLNMYLGVRGASQAWEVSVYGKNVTNTQRVLTRSATTLTSPLNAGNAATNYYGGDATSGLTMTAPREFGVNLRYAFGSK